MGVEAVCASDKPPTLGVDLGGTKVEIALVNEAGQVLASHRRLTHPEQEPDTVIADIVTCVEDCLSEAGRTAQGLGIGVAGQVDSASGMVRFAPNLGWRDIDLGVRLQQTLGMPVVVSNDVRAATYGEWRHGAGQGVNDLVCLFLGTGVGGGIVSGGCLLEGCSNTAGELGHITIVTGGRNCRCPNQGCLEAYTGGWAIAERAQEAASADHRDARRLLALAGCIERISAATVAQAYSDGDALARRLVEETAQYLAAGVVGIVNAFNPCLLILGGGVIQGLPDLVPMVEINVRAGALPAAVQGLRIVVSALADKAGVIGAAALAREKIAEPV
ncbi:MAG: ROK family protein [Chloroflexi bacterium]|nr:ROK family protein [Chloroflexota bacterium]